MMSEVCSTCYKKPGPLQRNNRTKKGLSKGGIVMAWEPNQGQAHDPNSPYGTPSNPYGAPPPQNPYGAPQNPYTPATDNPYAARYPYYQVGQGHGPPQSAPLPLG